MCVCIYEYIEREVYWLIYSYVYVYIYIYIYMLSSSRKRPDVLFTVSIGEKAAVL